MAQLLLHVDDQLETKLALLNDTNLLLLTLSMCGNSTTLNTNFNKVGFCKGELNIVKMRTSDDMKK